MKKLIKSYYFWTIFSIIVLTSAFFLFYNSSGDKVAVRINGIDFSYTEFQREFDSIVNSYKLYSMPVDKDEVKNAVIDRLVERAIITEKINELGIESSEEELQTQMDRNVKMFGFETEEELVNTLLEGGVSRKEIEDAIDYEVGLNKLIKYYTNGFNPTEEDLEEKYELYLSSIGEGEPIAFEDMKEELRDSTIEDFGLQKVFDLINEKKETVEVEILIPDEDIIFEEVEFEKVSSEFISCLKDKGVTIYTSSTCSACAILVQKYGGYDVLSPIVVDCNEEQDRCSREMLEDTVPSVVINGKLFQKEGTPENLARETGCDLQY